MQTTQILAGVGTIRGVGGYTILISQSGDSIRGRRDSRGGVIEA